MRKYCRYDAIPSKPWASRAQRMQTESWRNIVIAIQMPERKTLSFLFQLSSPAIAIEPQEDKGASCQSIHSIVGCIVTAFTPFSNARPDHHCPHYLAFHLTLPTHCTHFFTSSLSASLSIVNHSLAKLSLLSILCTKL